MVPASPICFTPNLNTAFTPQQLAAAKKPIALNGETKPQIHTDECMIIGIQNGGASVITCHQDSTTMLQSSWWQVPSAVSFTLKSQPCWRQSHAYLITTTGPQSPSRVTAYP